MIGNILTIYYNFRVKLCIRIWATLDLARKLLFLSLILTIAKEDLRGSQVYIAICHGQEPFAFTVSVPFKIKSTYRT